MPDRCTRTRPDGSPCPREALEGGLCHLHSPERARVRGRTGGHARAEKLRAQREAQAEAMRVDTLADLKASLTVAIRGATVDGDWSAVVSAVRAGSELLKTGELEKTVGELREMVEAYVRRGPVGVVR